MNKPDDFDLVPRNQQPLSPGAGQGGSTPPDPNDDEPEERRFNWGMVVTLAGVALLAFGVGAALFTLRDRLQGSPTPTPFPVAAIGTPIVEQPSLLQTLVAASTITHTTTPDVTPTLVVTETATPTPEPTATQTPTPAACALPVANGFQDAWQREIFGCPTSGAQIVWAASEPFERGAMLWRSDTNRSYVFTLAGDWQVIDASWDGVTTASRGEPPAGRYTPERGFGWVWGTSDPIFNALGWATDIEKGFCAETQDFENGFFVQSVAVDSCTPENLYNQATAADWQRTYIGAHNSGKWSGALGGSVVVAAAPTQMLVVDARPEAQGVFRAINAGAIVVDGSLADWSPSGWMPIANVVQGHDEHRGPEDAFGSFQVGWTAEGLVLAVQVQDDRHRPGPQGTDLWQGDSIEIQLDSRLASDFADTAANGDDVQIGIGFLRARDNDDGDDNDDDEASTPAMQLYRWLPLDQEGALPVVGVGRRNRGNYLMEVIIPWGYLGMTSPQAGSSYGFNISINDNDSNGRRQESVVSASPARTTYNNPTQWGTLILLP